MSNATPSNLIEKDITEEDTHELNKALSMGGKPLGVLVSEYTTEISEFKGNKVLNIFKGENRVFGFGLKKAQAVLACIEVIKKFVEDNKEES